MGLACPTWGDLGPQRPHLHRVVRPVQVRPSSPSLSLTQVWGLHPGEECSDGHARCKEAPAPGASQEEEGRPAEARRLEAAQTCRAEDSAREARMTAGHQGYRPSQDNGQLSGGF